MKGVASQSRVVLFDLQFLGLKFLVARGGVAGRGFAFLARLCAFNGDDFSCHKLFFLLGGLFLGFVVVGFHFSFPSIGYVEKGFREAHLVLEREYRTATVHQGYIEPHNAVAEWRAAHEEFWGREVSDEELVVAQRFRLVKPLRVRGC